MAILTYSGAYTVSGALEFIARSHKDRPLLDLMGDNNWRRLAAGTRPQPASPTKC
jgi:hypothetical protein